MGRAPCDKNGLKKGPWTEEEDLKLTNYIQIHGAGNWRTLPKNAGLERCGKSCRLRWTNYLRPDIKRGRFSFEEEESIIQLHSILGNKWSAIAARLPGRTDNEIKNYWNTHIRKRLLRNGIDPVTHTPRLDLLDLSSILSSALCNNPSSLHINNLYSNLFGTQPVFNPSEFLKMVSTLLSLKQENPETFLQFLHQNYQNHNSQIQTQLAHILLQGNQFQDASTCTTSFSNQAQPVVINQANDIIDRFSSNKMENFGYQKSEESLMCHPSSLMENLVSQPNYVACSSNPNPTVPILSENSSFQTLNNGSRENFNFDSVLSTPLSSPTPLNSSSTFINSNNEDERESYCSTLLNFEIPESLDINDFM